MSELEEKLSALMSNPQLMQQVAALAQSMGLQNSNDAPPPPPSQPPSQPALDPGMLQMLSKAVTQSGTDNNQQALLKALSPFVSTERIRKLEKAMRAAKLAGAASLFLNSGGLQMLTGR